MRVLISGKKFSVRCGGARQTHERESLTESVVRPSGESFTVMWVKLDRKPYVISPLFWQKGTFQLLSEFLVWFDTKKTFRKILKFIKITWFEWFLVLIAVCTANLVQFGFFHVTDPNWTKTYEIGRKPTQFGVIRGQCIGPVRGHSLYFWIAFSLVHRNDSLRIDLNLAFFKFFIE